jgi:hypothetical protein
VLWPLMLLIAAMQAGGRNALRGVVCSSSSCPWQGLQAGGCGGRGQQLQLGTQLRAAVQVSIIRQEGSCSTAPLPAGW